MIRGQTQNINMRHPVTIVVLSKYSDIFESFEANINQYAPGIDRILVRDGNLIDAVVPG